MLSQDRHPPSPHGNALTWFLCAELHTAQWQTIFLLEIALVVLLEFLLHWCPNQRNLLSSPHEFERQLPRRFSMSLYALP